MKAKRLAAVVSLIGALCVSSSTHAKDQSVWSGTISAEPAHGVDRAKDESSERRKIAPVRTSEVEKNWTFARVSTATESLPVVGLNDSLRVPSNEIPILKRKAERGDHEAAMKLASYYGVYLSDKKRQVYYYKLAAKEGSEVAVENLITIYSRTDADSFDFEKALLWRRRLKELARQKGLEIESDGDWGYGLYLDHLTDKDGGLFFLEYAAKHGSEKARRELIENYSNDSDVRNPEKTRNRKQQSDASNLIPIRNVALVSSAPEARVGSRIDDFRSAWGIPVKEEALVRTVRLAWQPASESNEVLPTDIYEAEVSFLDGIACQIVLRSKQPLKKSTLVKLGKALIPLFRTSDLANLKTESDGGRTYTLSSGGYMTAWAKEKPAVMVIRSLLFLQNNDLFDQEAAKVRPPTSNH